MAPEKTVFQKAFDFVRFPGLPTKAYYRDIAVESEADATRVRTNLTGIELYQQIFNGIDRGLGFKEAFNRLDWTKRIYSNERKIYWGTELHKAETIFNIQTQGCVGDRHLVGLVMPTAHNKELDFLAEVTRGLSIQDGMSRDEMYETYTKAWQQYLKRKERYPSATIPLLNYWGFSNPVDIQGYLNDPQLGEYGNFLAGIWADEVNRNSAEFGWEFCNKYLTYNEVLFMINIEGIQWLIRLDNISRPKKARGKLKTKMSNFKTGRFKPENAEQALIQERQRQLELWASEWFTAEVIKGKRELPQTNGAPFNIVTSVSNHSASGRTECNWRYYEYDILNLDVENISMNPMERSGFEKWLHYYSGMFTKYREDIRELNKRLPKFLK